MVPYAARSVEHEQSYREVCEDVAALRDKLGMSVDPGIFETVVALRMAHIETYQSCEGHLDHGCPYPWVIVLDREQERVVNRQWIVVCDLEQAARESGLPEAYERYLLAEALLQVCMERAERESVVSARLMIVLDRFYEQTEKPTPCRLIVRRLKSAGMYRLEPGFSAVAESLPDALKALYLEQARTEMGRFAVFLTQSGLSQKEAANMRHDEENRLREGSDQSEP